MQSQKGIVDLRRRRPGAPPRYISPLRFPERKQRTPLRVRRRRTRALFALALLLLIAGFAWAVSYASYLPRFNVSSLSIVGTHDVPPRLVQAYAETQLYDGTYPFLSRDNIFLFNMGALGREIIGYFPRIKTASVDRASMLATAVTVTITERQPFALWCATANDCYQMDDSGFVFAQSEATSSPQQYVFSGGIATSSHPIGQSFVPAHLPGILVLLQSLAQAGFPPHGASVDGEEDFSVPLAGQALQNGFYIKASFGEDADTLVKNLQLVLSSDPLQGKQDQLEYVDLRFGDKVYYKLKGQPQAF